MLRTARGFRSGCTAKRHDEGAENKPSIPYHHLIFSRKMGNAIAEL
jgi:hypothetical protein